MIPALAPEDEERELSRLLETVRRATGVDFGGYARTTVLRRLRDVVARRRLGGLAGLHAAVVGDPAARAEALEALCVNVTSMFRDAEFFRAYRALARARLDGAVRAWHAGCSTGEELWSHAIVLREEGLGRHARLYGTDISPAALEQASAGVLPLSRMREYTTAYQRAGGGRDFSAYYAAAGGRATVRAAVREGTRFARHDLAADAPFGAFDVVFCRNVLIYFGRALQEQVQLRLGASLRPGGLLALGRGEALVPAVEPLYETLDARNKIFLRLG